MNIEKFKVTLLRNYVDLMMSIDRDDNSKDIVRLNELKTIMFSLYQNISSYIDFNYGFLGAVIKLSEEECDFSELMKIPMDDIEEKPKGYVYVISYDGMTKIGISVNPKTRISSIQTANPILFQEYYVSESTEMYQEIEKEMHTFFNGKKIKGEWFDIKFKEAVDRLRILEVEIKKSSR